ncbi:potassium channel family protein [Nakamurella lactea]|uniref:potassium channel family protein n=1 Tax=Nakamurella lactea TaxID=459515 RepID=UPI00137788D8|nr:potassium channel family protein [Nakamurella lactea]
MLIAISLALTAIGLAVLSWMMVIELRRLHAGQEGRATGVLILMLGVLIMVFAMSFYLLERLAPAQFSGLVTRTDALYFTLTTMTTVGFGDVHAQGQLARVLVCGLIVFNVVVIAALVRALTSRRTPTP